MKDERGEIATLLTIGTLVVIGVTAVVSSLFVNNKNTIGSRASTGCSSNLQCSTYGGSAYTGVFSMKDGNYYPCSDCSCTSKGQSGWIGVCTKTGTGGTGDSTCTKNLQCSDHAGYTGVYSMKDGNYYKCSDCSCSSSGQVGWVGVCTKSGTGDTSCTKNLQCSDHTGYTGVYSMKDGNYYPCSDCSCTSKGQSGWIGVCTKTGTGTHDPACSIPASSTCPSTCANGCEACSDPDSSFKKCKGGTSYPDPNCGSNTMRSGEGDCYAICQKNNETYVGPSTTDNVTSHKCCCKPASGTAASCNAGKTYCTNQCAGNTDTSTGYYTGKDSKAGKNYENSDCSGTELDLSKFCCKGAAACGGATEANMCPDGNNVRNKCIGSTSGQYKCCGPHDNTQYPTANYATWNSEGKCGGATGLENLPPGCCFTDTDCNKYGSGQVCNIPNGSCGGSGGKSCNSNKKGLYQQQCVNQQCVNQPCDGANDECDKSKYCENSTKCQTQYGGFTCPEKDTGNNGKALYNWADGNGTKCVCMNCKVNGNTAASYYCGADTQNYVDGSLCCQAGQPGAGNSTCNAYGQNTCGLEGKACCTGAGIAPCKTAGLTCDTVKNTCNATTCTTSVAGKTIANDNKYHCIDTDTVGTCDAALGKARETDCGAGLLCADTNGAGKCDSSAATCNTSVAGKTIARDGKSHCVDNNTFGTCPTTGNASETDCATDLTCSETGYTGTKGVEAGCVKGGTGTGACSSAASKCNDYCKNTYPTTKPNAEANNSYWYANGKYSSDYTGTCKEDDIGNICKCTATPPAGGGTGSCSGTAKKCSAYCTETYPVSNPYADPDNDYWATTTGKFASNFSGTCREYGNVEDICKCVPQQPAPATQCDNSLTGTTCSSICAEVKERPNSDTPDTLYWKGLDDGDNTKYYDVKKCSGVSYTKSDLNTEGGMCGCHAVTTITFVNKCKTKTNTIHVDTVVFEWAIVYTKWYLVNEDLSYGQSVSKGWIGCPNGNGNGNVRYQVVGVGGTREFAYPIPCNTTTVINIDNC